MGWLTTERRIVSEWLAVALLATVGVALAVSLDLFQRADNLVYDQLIRLKQRPASNAVVIVTIDEESLSRLGGFPWPRSIHARALDRLEAAKPAAILY